MVEITAKPWSNNVSDNHTCYFSVLSLCVSIRTAIQSAEAGIRMTLRELFAEVTRLAVDTGNVVWDFLSGVVGVIFFETPILDAELVHLIPAIGFYIWIAVLFFGLLYDVWIKPPFGDRHAKLIQFATTLLIIICLLNFALWLEDFVAAKSGISFGFWAIVVACWISIYWFGTRNILSDYIERQLSFREFLKHYRWFAAPTFFFLLMLPGILITSMTRG